jgi:hypothetical protein
LKFVNTITIQRQFPMYSTVHVTWITWELQGSTTVMYLSLPICLYVCCYTMRGSIQTASFTMVIKWHKSRKTLFLNLALFCIGTNLVGFLVYWIGSLFFCLVDLTGRPAWVLRYKIQGNKQVPVSKILILLCIV